MDMEYVLVRVEHWVDSPLVPEPDVMYNLRLRSSKCGVEMEDIFICAFEEENLEYGLTIVRLLNENMKALQNSYQMYP